jgi:hypothetical protein
MGGVSAPVGCLLSFPKIMLSPHSFLHCCHPPVFALSLSCPRVISGVMVLLLVDPPSSDHRSDHSPSFRWYHSSQRVC